MPDIPIEQALYRRPAHEAPVFAAHSPGFRDEWRAEAEWLLTAFGEPTAGARCPQAVFAYPFGKQHVAVVQVTDQVPAAALAFRLLVLPRDAYGKLLGDPFAVSDRFPPSWDARELPSLSLPAVALPPRTVDDVRRVLQRVKSGALLEGEDISEDGEIRRTVENSESPALLGGVQLLVDGGKLVFIRPAPDTDLVRGLWTLLPTSTRAHLWPASFAFGNTLEFDAVVVPRAPSEDFPGYTTEEQAADYPEGRYELRLQTAAEAGDQGALDSLLCRRSTAETWKLGLTLVFLVTFLSVVSRLLPGRAQPDVTETRARQAVVVTSLVGIRDPLGAAVMSAVAHEEYDRLERDGPRH
jgi:hypothetical protein